MTTLSDFYSMVDNSVAQDATVRSLPDLVERCNDQIQNFKRGRLQADSHYCTEIVRRAASDDDAALHTLIAISEPIIRQQCMRNQSAIQDRAEDVIAHVGRRLTNRFRKPGAPFKVSTFAAYHEYLNLTVQSVMGHLLNRMDVSLDGLMSESGYEPSAPDDSDRIERELIWDEILIMLANPLEREAFNERFRMRKSVDETVMLLQSQAPGITKKRVYRLVENALRRLKKNSKFRQLVEELR